MNFKETMNYKFEYGAPVALTLSKKIKQTWPNQTKHNYTSRIYDTI